MKSSKSKDSVTNQSEAISKNFPLEEEKQIKLFQGNQINEEAEEESPEVDAIRLFYSLTVSQKGDDHRISQGGFKNVYEEHKDPHGGDVGERKDETLEGNQHLEEQISKQKEHDSPDEHDDDEHRGFQPQPSQSLIEDPTIKEYMQEFNKYDANKDGTIPVSDLFTILKNLRKDPSNCNHILRLAFSFMFVQQMMP